jgi:hypothetical protein
MARPRTPTAILELRGAFKNHPSRLKERKYEPLVLTGLPDPPPRLDKLAASMWLEMKAKGFWLTSADKFLVEIAAAFMAAYRDDRLKSADTALLIGLLGKIGFSPNERGKLNLPTPKQNTATF